MDQLKQRFFLCVGLFTIVGFIPDCVSALTLSDLPYKDVTQNKIVIAQSANAEIALNRGNSLFNAGNYSDAIKAYTVAIENSTQNDQIYIQARLSRSTAYVLARIYESLGDDDYDQFVGAAIADCSRVISLEPSNPAGYSCRAFAYTNTNVYNKEAFADYDQAIKLAPNDPMVYYNRGYAYYLMDNNQKAIADFSQSIKLNPTFERAYYERSWAERLSNPRNAVEDLTTCICSDLQL